MRWVYFSAKRRIGSHRGRLRHQGVPRVLIREEDWWTEIRKRMANLDPNQRKVFSSLGVLGVGDAVRMRWEGIGSRRRMEKKKVKKKDYMYVTESDGSDALISPWLVPVNNEWLIQTHPFTPLTNTTYFKIMWKVNLKRCIWEMMNPATMSNKGMWWLASQMAQYWMRNVRHIRELKRNLISVS